MNQVKTQKQGIAPDTRKQCPWLTKTLLPTYESNVLDLRKHCSRHTKAMLLAYKNNERNQRETNSGFSINSKSVIRRLSCRDAACRVLEGRGPPTAWWCRIISPRFSSRCGYRCRVGWATPSVPSGYSSRHRLCVS